MEYATDYSVLKEPVHSPSNMDDILQYFCLCSSAGRLLASGFVHFRHASKNHAPRDHPFSQLPPMNLYDSCTMKEAQPSLLDPQRHRVTHRLLIQQNRKPACNALGNLTTGAVTRSPSHHILSPQEPLPIGRNNKVSSSCRRCTINLIFNTVVVGLPGN